MMLPSRHYESEHTRFIRELLEERPDLVGGLLIAFHQAVIPSACERPAVRCIRDLLAPKGPAAIYRALKLSRRALAGSPRRG